MDTFLLERGPFASSRGSFIITQKENKGEYGAVNCGNESCITKPEWKWDNSNYDWDIYAHVFDQNGPNGSDGTPYQYSSNIEDWSKTSSQYWNQPNAIPRCTTTTASGRLDFSTQNPYTEKACIANPYNAGNWYSFPAATAGSDNKTTSAAINMPNSICSKGWQLPPNSDNKSYNNLFRSAYGVSSSTSDIEILASPLSFVRLGGYGYSYGSLNNRGRDVYYWLSTSYSATHSRRLYSNSGNLLPQDTHHRAYGFSVRCVSH